ncbi:sodium/proline symporter PutP [Prauserella halophila]|uniref:Sodium/proline symporter PutP n=1 Tax=Prauserella halophila TaxID=185641 RepID=A0ABP4GNS4_9PSEU|nr:sodium/solute symporter [Prauserella halophila]MCP2235396.1 cation/acetate symporter [Prauserella halophila]
MTLMIVLGYFLVLIAIGMVAYRRVRNSTDEFFVAGRSLGTFVNSWAFIASLASGGSVMASVGSALALGFPFAAALVAGAPVGFVVASVLVARPLRNLGKYTVPDFFDARFNSPMMRVVVPVLIVIASSVYIVSQLKGSAIVAGHLLGWDYQTALWIAGIVFVLYVSIGGFLSVTWNDIFQGILLFSCMVGLGIAAFSAMGDFPAAWNATLEAYPALTGAADAHSIWSYVGAFLTWATAISVLPHVIMRVYSARNVRSARVSLNTAMLLFGVMMLIVAIVLVPAAATLLPNADITDPDALFLTLADRVFGPIGQGLLAAAVLAAIMSTTAGLLMACNSAIGHDLYHRLLRPQASQKEVIRVTQAATWVVGILCILLAINPPEFLIVLYTAAVALLASAFFAPMVLGIWWRRTTAAGAGAGMIGGAVLFGTAFAMGLPTSSEVLIALPASFLLTIVVSLVTSSGRDDDARDAWLATQETDKEATADAESTR